jgi:hypothetical protein
LRNTCNERILLDMDSQENFTPRQIQLMPLDESPRWFFNRCIDLDKWLPAITNHSGESQDNDGALVAAFDQDCAPCERHGMMMAASREMYVLLKAGLPLLRMQAEHLHNSELLALCDAMAQRLIEIDGAAGPAGTDRPAW